MADEDMPEAHVYHVNRWDCPECGEVHESDADFESVEKCDECGETVSVR